MSLPPRGLPASHLRQQSASGSLSTASIAGQSLQARVNDKRAELENLKELRDLSAAVASQMETLEQKLATLSDGTEGVDCRHREPTQSADIDYDSDCHGYGELA
jgi:DASH complex subunit DAD2